MLEVIMSIILEKFRFYAYLRDISIDPEIHTLSKCIEAQKSLIETPFSIQTRDAELNAARPSRWLTAINSESFFHPNNFQVQVLSLLQSTLASVCASEVGHT